MILIFPWARKTTDGKLSPKDYPCWPEVVGMLRARKLETHQISCKGESDIGCDRRSNDLSLSEIGDLLKSCSTWASVDSFLPHMAWTLKERGVVIFGPSDPEIFGHPENINILKDRRFLRSRQFGLWSQETPNPECFCGASAVMEAIRLSIKNRKASSRT